MAPAHGLTKKAPASAVCALLLSCFGCNDDAEVVHPDPGSGPVVPDHERTGVPAISGGTLAISHDGKYAVAADSDRDQIYTVDLSSHQVQTVTLAPGSEPGRVALDRDGRAHVVLRAAGGIASVDVSKGILLAQRSVCALPRGIAFDQQTDAVFVACGDGSLVSLATTDGKELSRVTLDRDLRDVVFDAEGRMHVSRYRSAELLEVSRAGDVLARHAPGQTVRDPNSGFGNGILIDDASEPAFFDAGVAPSIPAPQGSDVAPLPPGDAGAATSPAFVAPVDAGTPLGVDAAVTLPDEGLDDLPPLVVAEPVNMSPTTAWRTLLNAKGELVMLHERAQVDVVVTQSGGYGSGGCNTIAQVGFSFLVDGSLQSGAPLANATLAVDAAFSLDGKWVAVAAAGEIGLSSSQNFPDAGLIAAPNDVIPAPIVSGNINTVSVYSTDTSDDGDCQIPILIPHEPGTQGQAIALAFTSSHELVVLSREPAQLELYQYDDSSPFPTFVLTATVPLSELSAKDPGHDLFHANAGGGIACATCHGEGTDDGHIWNFADVGPRRTQNMRGGLLATAPFHWEGDLSNLRSLMDEVFTSRMGGFGVSDAEVTSLGGWLDSLPTLHALKTVSDAAVRGKALFESQAVGCTSCHSGEHLTNNESADVGTGGLFQVPSLQGLSARAPFMHDGCAETLADRFKPACGGGDEHGHTSQLSADELADLIAYLDTL